MANSTHRAPGTKGKQKRTTHVTVFEGGAAFTKCARQLRRRRVKTGNVTMLLDTIYDTKRDEARDRRETKRLDVIEEQRRKDATKGVRFNTAMTETLASDKDTLEAHMEMLGNVKG
jgi:hypothetical protein